MQKVDVTIVIPVRNEGSNIRRCLISLNRAAYVVVVDSGSSDTTLQESARCGAAVVAFSYAGGYPKKRQWFLDTWHFETQWVMFVDADERVTDELWDEIQSVCGSSGGCTAYTIRKDFCFLGQRFRFGGFSHRAVTLFRVGTCRFEELTNVECGLDMEVHERLIVHGVVGSLRSGLEHWDARGLHHYLRKHNDYSTWEAGARRALRGQRIGSVVKQFTGVQRWRRLLKWLAIRIPGEPLLWFVYHYLVRLAVLEGRRGLIASRIRASYISDVRDKMWEEAQLPLTLDLKKDGWSG